MRQRHCCVNKLHQYQFTPLIFLSIFGARIRDNDNRHVYSVQKYKQKSRQHKGGDRHPSNMHSVFRFLTTLFVSFSVVQAFFSSSHRWQNSIQRQQAASALMYHNFYSRQELIRNTASNSNSRTRASSSSSSLSSDVEPSAASSSRAINSGNSSAFLDFDGMTQTYVNGCPYVCVLFHLLS